MPVGWVDKSTAPYYQSAYKKGLKISRRKKSEKSDENAVNVVLSPEFLLFLAWISIGNLDAIFVTFTWSQFARYIMEDYMELVDFFGNLLWTAAVWSIVSGLITDWLSSKISKPALEAKVIVILGTMFFDNFCGLLMHGLQGRESFQKSFV